MAGVQTIRAAAAQIPAYRLDQAALALASIERAVVQAAEQGVGLLVLPECAYPAYLIGSVEAYRRAGVLKSDEYVVLLARLARKRRMHIVSGLVEDVGTHLHNSAVLIDDQGQEVGKYRKSFLWASDNEWFKPGDRVPVFPTRLGRIGIVICADTRAPEIFAKLAGDGAQLVAMPTCWINTAADRGGFENPQPEFLISARAAEFGLPLVCANKFGIETEKVGYCGRSLIAAADGRIVKEAPGDAEMLLSTDLQISAIQTAELHGELWESLITWQEPVRPRPDACPRIRMAVWPDRFLSLDDFERHRDAGVQLLVVNGATDERVDSEGSVVILTNEHVGALRSTAVGKIGCVHGGQFRQFGRTRLLALGGAEIVCVFDSARDLKLLRTRAVENRIFVVGVAAGFVAVVSPGGEILAHSPADGQDRVAVDINLADAANKLVAAGTDIWEQRRVKSYR